MSISIPLNNRIIDPVYVHLTSIYFNNTYLDELLYQMDSNIMMFNVNVIDDKIEPLEIIMNMIAHKKKMTVTKINTDKYGKVIFEIILNDFQFISINNLFDFNYSDMDNLMKLEVSYIFSNIEYVNINDLKMERMVKIYKILKKDSIYPTLTKEELKRQ